MAEEMVQIKQEPLEIIYAAEMDDIEGDATNQSSSSRSNEGSFDVSDKRAYSLIKAVNTGNFSANVTIKVEPDLYEYTNAEATEFDDDINQQNSMSSASMAQNVQVKEEPVDDYLHIAEDCNMSENLPYSANVTPTDEDQLNLLTNDFQVVDEHENIITITATDLSPNNTELAYMPKLKQNGPMCNRRTKKYMCKICLKRCFEEIHYRQHMEQHRKNRLYCTRKACDNWFFTLEECENHEQLVHDIKHLKCDVCNHKFQNFEQMCQHKETMHSKLKRFVCSMCRDWFISKIELHEHWQSLPDRCGRMISILNETPKLTKSIEEVLTTNTYKFKNATSYAPAGLKLRLKPTLFKNTDQQSNTKMLDDTVEIKTEPVDYEMILPDFPVKVKRESTNNTEINKSSLASEERVGPPLKLRIRKELLTPAASESENVVSTSTQEVKTNPLSHLLAQRITSKFSLKSVPKYFNLANKAGEEKIKKPAHTTSPQSLLKSSVALQQRNTNATQTAKVSPKSEHMPKMLKLSSNFKIVKMLPKDTQPTLVKLGINNPLQQATTKRTLPKANTPQVSLLAKTEKLMPMPETALNWQKDATNNRQFAIQQVEVPPLNKVVAAAKLESVTKTNTEISLTELLNDVIVHKSEQNAEMIAQNIDIKTENIKTEFDEDMITLQYDDDLSAATFSDSSSNATSLRIYREDGDLPPRPRSPHLTRNRCRSKPKVNPEGYICPKCSRRYSTRSMIREHMRNSCGRNPQHECDVCHKFFFSTSTLNCHRTIHTGVLPHKCNYCDKRFRTRGQVTVHHRTHTGERPFVCEICSQSFTHRETLISHLSRHIGMKRYKCYGCNKQFSCISGLSMHRATRPETCGQFELNTRAIGPRVRVIRGRVVFEPQPADPDDDAAEGDDDMNADTVDVPEVLSEIQNK
ncbi:uncharacterized protein LOC105223377 [Bactrocera dorsalis]|uniref:Uncharacterized protein LOC105223377 n=1 Tax=Bactrocera dorsalis TaxID=27457 RepID=A0A6I9V944_BACDO|nr:uncharacterized protein LOC105223377 [Bactrocera dorsalis]